MKTQHTRSESTADAIFSSRRRSARLLQGSRDLQAPGAAAQRIGAIPRQIAVRRRPGDLPGIGGLHPHVRGDPRDRSLAADPEGLRVHARERARARTGVLGAWLGGGWRLSSLLGAGGAGLV